MSIEKACVLHLFFCLHTVDIFIWCYWLILVWYRKRCSSSQLFVTQIYKGCILSLLWILKQAATKYMVIFITDFMNLFVSHHFFRKLVSHCDLIQNWLSESSIDVLYHLHLKQCWAELSTIKFRRIRELKFS